jgi:hypothetical protein
VKEYENYELELEFKWGQTKSAPRLDAKRDSGVLYREDGGDMDLCLLSRERELSQFLRLAGHEGSELAGPAFNPAGDRLYFSSQRGTRGSGLGVTFEVSGPFRR